MRTIWIELKHYWRLFFYGLRTAGLRESIAAFRADVPNAAVQADNFDAVHGTETSASMFPWDAGLSRQDQAQSIVYMASDRMSFQRMLQATGLNDGEFSHYVFVDVGAGKGRVVLMAGEYPFRGVIGVELSQSLIDIAHANIQRCRGLERRSGALQVIKEHASRFDFPLQPLMLYFYHPFTTPTMRSVMSRIVTSLKQEPRTVYILYRQPLFGAKYPDECLAAGGMFDKIAEQPGSRCSLRNPWAVWRYLQTGL